MKLSEFKTKLNSQGQLIFRLSDGTPVPPHFHVTEIGQVTKHFIDCGGTIRHEQVVNFQLFEAGDVDHRLAPEKLQKIISQSEKALELKDGEIEVEYQQETIGKFGLEFSGDHFALIPKNTACLASDHCGIPAEKQKKNLSELQTSKSCCSPESGCCS